MNSIPLITKENLEEAGITLEGRDIEALLNHLNDNLEERVGAEITESLSDEKLEELVSLQENASDDEVANWIEANVPELQQIVQDEIDIIIGELAENAEDINTAA